MQNETSHNIRVHPEIQKEGEVENSISKMPKKLRVRKGVIRK
jgi:hypothetical protein